MAKASGFYARFGKRLIDVVGSAILLVALLPLMLLLGVIVSIFLGWPALFRQERAGLGGRTFTMAKFRSMTNAVDSEGNPLPDHERLGKFGRLLRSTSLDELPSLWNILVGHMSFVGPRPLLPAYVPYYTPEESRRHDVRPGLTGLAAVRGRNAITWEDLLRYDIEYVDNLSLGLDLWIVGQTFVVCLKREGVETARERFDVERAGRAQ